MSHILVTYTRMMLSMLFIALPVAKAAVPGTFFWKPRVGLDLVGSTEPANKVHQPNQHNIAEGLVVLIDGYQAGVTVMALVVGINAATPFRHLNPSSAYFYTNLYRWGLRYMSLIPHWLVGSGGNYVATHKVWRRRFYYTDEFVPDWLEKLIPYVKKAEWDQEKTEFKRWKKYVEPAFGKHYRYPDKWFNNFASQNTAETVKNLDASSNSIAED